MSLTLEAQECFANPLPLQVLFVRQKESRASSRMRFEACLTLLAVAQALHLHVPPFPFAIDPLLLSSPHPHLDPYLQPQPKSKPVSATETRRNRRSRSSSKPLLRSRRPITPGLRRALAATACASVVLGSGVRQPHSRSALLTGNAHISLRFEGYAQHAQLARYATQLAQPNAHNQPRPGMGGGSRREWPCVCQPAQTENQHRQPLG